jgi:LacI family transcriptional regulator
VAKNTDARRKRPTLTDVAAKAGVSRATASLVIRNSPLVASSTRVKVLEAMRAIGYVYNRAAASLRSQGTLAIGMVVPDICNPFFAELTLGVESELENQQYAVFVVNTSESKSRQELAIRRIVESRMDGLLLCPSRGTFAAELDWVLQLGVPLVAVSRRIAGLEVDYVGADNAAAGRIAADYLVRLGHTNIAFVGGEGESSARQERIRGVRQALKAVSLAIPKDLAPECRATRSDATRITASLLARDDRPTALIGYNDVVALGILDAMHRARVKPGRDVSLVGFDDIDEAAISVPPLTTVANRPRDLGREATRVLLRRIQNPPEQHGERLLNGSLIQRETAGPPRK